MQKTLSALALLALAAVASAQSTAVTSSSLIASYRLGTGVSFGGYTSFEYSGGPGIDGESFDDDGGRAVALVDGSTTHSHADGTNVFSMGMTASATLFSNDYAAITPGAVAYAEAFRGYTYLLTFTAGAAGGDVTFDLHTVQSLVGAAASPIGLSVYDPATDAYGTGASAYGSGRAGVADATGDPYGQPGPGDSFDTYKSTNNEDMDAIPTPTYEFLDSATYSRTFTLTANQTRVYRVHASGYAYGDYSQPVPEPASLLALGAGALGLRRRRKA